MPSDEGAGSNAQIIKSRTAATGRSAIDLCAVIRPHLVITELRMQGMDGLELLSVLKRRWPDVSVIILTAHGTIRDAVRATQCGAFGFLVKPVEKSELLGTGGTCDCGFFILQGQGRLARGHCVAEPTHGRPPWTGQLALREVPRRCCCRVNMGRERNSSHARFTRRADGARRRSPWSNVGTRPRPSLEAVIFGAAKSGPETESPIGGGVCGDSAWRHVIAGQHRRTVHAAAGPVGCRTG